MFISSFISLWYNSPMRLNVYAHMQKQVDCDFSYCQVDKWKQANENNYVRKEVGGGIRMGNTCKSMADSCQCMAKTTTIL